MRVLEFYDGTKTYMFPNMKIATPQVMLQEFPAITTFKHVIETDEAGEVCFAVENFSAMKSRYNIDNTLSDNEALAAIQEILNTPVEEEVSPEERIASALEFQNMMMLPDEEEE